MLLAMAKQARNSPVMWLRVLDYAVNNTRKRGLLYHGMRSTIDHNYVEYLDVVIKCWCNTIVEKVQIQRVSVYLF